MQSQFPQHQFVHIEVDTMIVGKARNMIAETAMPQDVELLWWIDNDVLIPPDSGVLIEQAKRLGVVTGLYFNRRPPYTPQVFDEATEPENKGKYWPIVELPEGGIHSIAAAGMGCMVMRKDILFQMKESWDSILASIPVLPHPSVDSIVRGLSPWFEFLNAKGEDLYFFERLKDAGITAYANYDVECAHIGEVDIQKYDFQYLIDNNLLKRIDDAEVEVEVPS